MKNTIVVLLLSFSMMTPCVSASERFLTDKPSPLKLAKAAKDRSGIVHFTGNVQLSGRFFVGWELIDNKPTYLRVIFFPDKESTALLPHAAENGPVKELIFSNLEQAVSILLDDPATAQKILAKDQLSTTGEATVTIRDYGTVIECDQRWYMAQLVSASKQQRIVVGARENGRFGC